MTPWNSFCLQGFDEYMNLVLDEAEEVHLKTKARKPLGEFIVLESKILSQQNPTLLLFVPFFLASWQTLTL